MRRALGRDVVGAAPHRPPHRPAPPAARRDGDRRPAAEPGRRSPATATAASSPPWPGWSASPRTSAREPGAEDDEVRFRTLIEAPLLALGAGEAPDALPDGLVERTLEALAPLRDAGLPLVLEHGDTSHPNLLLRRFGDLAVVDWELADPDGLPGHDLAFFLVYAAGAARRREEAETARRLHDAFFGSEPWAWRWWAPATCRRWTSIPSSAAACG